MSKKIFSLNIQFYTSKSVGNLDKFFQKLCVSAVNNS